MQFYVISFKHGSPLNVIILIGCNKLWQSLSCTTVPFPFGNLNNKKILDLVNNNNNESKNSISSLILKLPTDLTFLFNQFNNTNPENDSDLENVIQSKYLYINEMQQLKIPNKENSLSFFHINSCLLNKNFEELQSLLQSRNIKFDVVAIAEITNN